MAIIVGTMAVTTDKRVPLMGVSYTRVVDADLSVVSLGYVVTGSGSVNPCQSGWVDSFSVIGAVFNRRDMRYVLAIGDRPVPIESFTIRRSSVDELTFNLPDGIEDFSPRITLSRVIGGVEAVLFSGFISKYDKPKLVALSDGVVERFARIITLDQIVYFSFSSGQLRARVMTDQDPRIGDTVIMDNLSYTVTAVTEYVSLESVLTEVICA